MSEEAQDEASKTEQPTQKRLEDAAKKGDVGRSQEINHWFVFMAGALLLAMFAGGVASDFTRRLLPFIERPHDFRIDAPGMRAALMDVFMSVAGMLGPAALILVLAALAASLVQAMPVISGEKIMPQFSRINPASGFGRLFSAHNAVEFAKGILKICIVGAVGTWLVWPELDRLPLLVTADPAALLPASLSQVLRFLSGIIAVMTLVAGADLVWQKLSNLQKLRMTRQEVKEEHKQQEGDPTIKARIRQIRVQRSRRRMMAAVKTADVIVTNPTHYAVALKYEAQAMGAPRVVAKGVDSLALRIRAVATESAVPIVENVPLARALYKVDLDTEIPEEHYKAVAEIISFVYRLKGRAKGAAR